MYIFLFTCTYICAHVCEGQRSILGDFLNLHIRFFWTQCYRIWLDLLPGDTSPGTLLSSRSQYWDNRHDGCLWLFQLGAEGLTGESNPTCIRTLYTKVRLDAIKAEAGSSLPVKTLRWVQQSRNSPQGTSWRKEVYLAQSYGSASSWDWQVFFFTLASLYGGWCYYGGEFVRGRTRWEDRETGSNQRF